MKSSTPSSDDAASIEKPAATGAIRAIWNEKRTFGWAVFSALGGFLYGYNLGCFGGILVMPSFQRAFPSFTDSTLKGLATSMINLGALLGTLATGWSADKFGRRRSITLSCVWLILGTALQTGARSPAYFYVGRFFTGIAVGALSSATPLYNSEISPTSIRGAVGSLFQFSIEVGTLIAFWIDFGCNYIGGTGETQTEAAWRIPLALQLVPCFILAVGILFAPESPRWLVSKSRDAEALRALVSLRQRPEDSDEIQLEYLEIVGQHKFESEIAALEKDPNEKATGWMASLRTSWRQWAYLFGSAANRKRLLVGVMIMTFQQWCGINAIMFYAPQIFQGLGLSGTTVSLLATGVIGIVMLIATVPTVLYLDRVGRKPVLIYGALFMGTCHAVIAGLSGKYEDSWVTHKAAGWVSCVFVWIFTVGFAATFGPVVWVLCSEIFPLRARTKGLAVSVSVSWINAFIVGMATPTMLDNMRYGTYIFFAAWCFIGAAYCCTIPETAGRRLEDMDAAFGDTSNSSEEDKARMARINKEIGYDKYQMGHLSDSKSEM